MEIKMKKGIKVYYTNGQHDSFDPCDSIKIDNGVHKYEIKVDDILKLETYDIDVTE